MIAQWMRCHWVAIAKRPYVRGFIVETIGADVKDWGADNC
jgi:hypothetical protein